MITERIKKYIYLIMAAVLIGFHLYTAAFGVIPGIGQKAIHLLLALILFYLGRITSDEKKALRIIDVMLLLMAVAGIVYVIAIDSSLDLRAGIIYTEDIVFGLMLLTALLYASWRGIGKVLTITVLVFIAYAFLGQYMPAVLRHSGISLGRFINLTVLTTEGVFGTALYASAVYIVLFIILGALFTETGVGDYFTGVSMRAFGSMTGGPAKVAVVASGIFGSVNGSSIANVMGTGTFTIPIMKKTGFDADTAGAVEAAASTGGQMMPPIMGTTAFIAAEFVGISYWDFALGSLIPALLYYAGLLISVDLYARRHGLRGVPAGELPEGRTLLKRAYLFAPLLFLIICIGFFKTSITRAGLYTIIFTVLLTSASKSTRLTWERLKRVCKTAAGGIVTVSLACGTVGIIIAVVNGSGLAYRLSGLLVGLSGGNKLLLLLLTMIVSIILGMGVPTTAAYLVLAVLVAPTMIKLGISTLGAHLFVLYFGVISNITPPVALAAYAAAGISGGSPNKTGYKAFELAASGFVIPFIFACNPALLLEGSALSVVLSLAATVAGIYLLAAAIEGYFVKWRINVMARVACGIGAAGTITFMLLMI